MKVKAKHSSHYTRCNDPGLTTHIGLRIGDGMLINSGFLEKRVAMVQLAMDAKISGFFSFFTFFLLFDFVLLILRFFKGR